MRDTRGALKKNRRRRRRKNFCISHFRVTTLTTQGLPMYENRAGAPISALRGVCEQGQDNNLIISVQGGSGGRVHIARPTAKPKTYTIETPKKLLIKNAIIFKISKFCAICKKFRAPSVRIYISDFILECTEQGRRSKKTTQKFLNQNMRIYENVARKIMKSRDQNM